MIPRSIGIVAVARMSRPNGTHFQKRRALQLRGPAAAGATAIRRGEGRIARAVGQGGAVGGHAPPPAFAEPQPRRALPRRRTNQSTLAARVAQAKKNLNEKVAHPWKNQK